MSTQAAGLGEWKKNFDLSLQATFPQILIVWRIELAKLLQSESWHNGNGVTAREVNYLQDLISAAENRE